MAVSEITKKVVDNLNKLSNPKLPKEEFDSISREIMNSLKISTILSEVTESDIVFLGLLRLHCINYINFIQAAKMQGEFNRMIISKIKETGKDVTNLDIYLNDNVRPYFPNHDE